MKLTCMKKILFLICLVFVYSNSKACLNLFAIDSFGRVVYLEHRFLSELQFNQQEIEKRISNLEKEQFTMQNISDYAAYLLMSGNFADGLKIIKVLYFKYPSVYEINANLAVAYELNGLIDSALVYQKKAMLIKPSAHENSEWLHLKILEARKQVLVNPDWCIVNDITGIEKGISDKFKYQSHEFAGTQVLFNNFISQLKERMPFSFAEDRVLGKLFLELGNAYQNISVYRAYYCYAMAKYFYPQLEELCKQKMSKIKEQYPKEKAKGETGEINLYNNNRSFNEMLPPDDTELNSFLKRVINRSKLKRTKLTKYKAEDLVNKL
jgi:hypothetical protein